MDIVGEFLEFHIMIRDRLSNTFKSLSILPVKIPVMESENSTGKETGEHWKEDMFSSVENKESPTYLQHFSTEKKSLQTDTTTTVFRDSPTSISTEIFNEDEGRISMLSV